MREALLKNGMQFPAPHMQEVKSIFPQVLILLFSFYP